MKRLFWRLRLALFRLPPRHYGDPNFLFSLPPFVYPAWVPTIVVAPTGGDDTPNLQAAFNRLTAIGGGTVQVSGEYLVTAPVTIGNYQSLQGDPGSTFVSAP